MPLLRARRPLAAVLVVGALVVAGCSGDDDDVGTAASDSSASSVTVDSSASTVAASTTPDATGSTQSGASAAASTATTVAPASGGTGPGATGTTSAPAGGNGPLATRDLTGQDLCPVLSGDEVSAVVGLPIGLAEANPSYKDPNCVYYKANAGQAVSLTKAGGDYYDQQGAQAEAVSSVGDQAKWAAQQLTLFVKAKGSTLVVSVFQVAKPGTEKDAAVAVAQKVIANL